ncbi:putative Holin-X, holin superfamily III [Terrimicrobium sacchariphilum]|uniref:Putative Holin-X, holin superfamily III n=1 Tax=Terrimicrobium sacchariphilum TaxID=690879 RepID=A0A146GC15_TERSA|nr:phage holin family protein [Terrimicrobium sacchariphilum]GAT34921.1 putative Holin-X, holin superfamily III [Terrimicrobium sacchariphilum]
MSTAAVPPPEGRGESHGLIDAITHLCGSLGRHVHALSSLAGVEAKEAAGVYLRVAIAVAAGLLLGLFAYLLLLLSIAFLLALLGVSWLWITLGLGLLHVGGVAACYVFIRGQVSKPVFATTQEELRKDFASLKSFRL